ncbi:unnamed protein product [Coffea canephora]|uniref:Pentacotripeptide-repeat region of PRORP domain-containing protein n=1 Tax=Coffea canephora TaxID=49390 RepID=A0A068UUN3_COFCA|nr:unnamed protein product [Coffea canephora]
MRYTTRFKLPQLRRSSSSLHNHRNFSANPLRNLPQTQPSEPILLQSQEIYKLVLEKCLRECKKVQSRRLFDEMPQKLICSLKAGKTIHSYSLKLGFASKGSLGGAIVDLYSKCGDMEFAEKAFFLLEKKDNLAWNSILSLYSRKGLLKNVVERFSSMRKSGKAPPNQFTYAIVLSVCARLMHVDLGKQVHCSIVKTGYEFDSFCGGALVDMFSKTGNLDDARRIFDDLIEPDTVSWTAMISGYVHAGFPEEALELFEEMRSSGQVPDQVAFGTVINACVRLGRLDDAWRLFSDMPNKNVVTWNVMISGHCKVGYEMDAVKFFLDMIKAGIKPTRSTLGSVLSAIAGVASLELGVQVHAKAMKQGLDANVYVGSSLINMYAKCKRMEAAKQVFNGVSEKNDVIWNALLGGYAQNGHACEVVELFTSMTIAGFQHDEFTYTSILSACSSLENVEMGCQLHSALIKRKYALNLFVGNALVDMYAKCGALKDARKQFELMTTRDNVSWNAIIVGYVQEEEEGEAFDMFHAMKLGGIAPDEVSLASILSACANVQALDKGKQVHCLLIKYGLETSLYTGSSLIDMYSKCGVIGAATEVFSCMPERSVVSTNALIAGYALSNIDCAGSIFKYMLAEGLKPSEVTFASLLDACSDPSKMCLGKQIHCFILKLGISINDEFLAISLLQMYLNSQIETEAIVLFSELPVPKSTVLWTALISGLAQNSYSDEALKFYQEMRLCNAMPDQATFASVLKACSVLASLQNGRKIHSLVVQTGLNEDELTGSALLDMYAKCGDVRSSECIFDEMVTRNDVITWNSMIVGFAKNGYAKNAFKIFEQMKQTNVKPDEVTFLGILTACSHAGMVSEGQRIFHDMVAVYGVQPRLDHYACMIDIFGRWGFLMEAEDFIEKLSFEPDSMIWAPFLSACRLHGDDTRGKHAAEKLIELEPQNSSPYVLLSNIYAALSNWDEVNSLRRDMNEKGVRKSPGCSWITVGEETNYFIAGDKLHRSAGKIYAILTDLMEVMGDESCFSEIQFFMVEG